MTNFSPREIVSELDRHIIGQREHVVALGLEGLDFREEARRAYPRGVLAGQVLGYTNVDGKGIAGIELSYDDALQAGGQPVRLTLDIGAQVPHSALRTYVMGERGLDEDPATGDDIHMIVKELTLPDGSRPTLVHRSLPTRRSASARPGAETTC